MKLKLFLLTILSFLFFGLVSAHAQTEIDSLTLQLRTATDASVKLDLYKKIGW